MDKKHHPKRHKSPTDEELDDIAPPGVSFNTESGRAAQGMRPDIGQREDDEIETLDEMDKSNPETSVTSRDRQPADSPTSPRDAGP